MRERLQQAYDGRLLVRIHRSGVSDSAHIDGRVEAVSDAVVVVSSLLDDRIFGGFVALPVSDVTDVEAMPGAALWENVLARRGGLPNAPELRTEGLGSVVASVPDGTRLILLELRDDPEVVWIGVPKVFDSRSISLRHIDPSGDFYEDPIVYPWSHVSRVSFGGPYLHALGVVQELEAPAEPEEVPPLQFELYPDHGVGPFRFDQPIPAEIRKELVFHSESPDGTWVRYADPRGRYSVVESIGEPLQIVVDESLWFRGCDLIGLSGAEARMLLADHQPNLRTHWDEQRFLWVESLGLRLHLDGSECVSHVTATARTEVAVSVAALARSAQQAGRVVRIERRDLQARAVEGVITGVGERLLCLHRLGEDLLPTSVVVLRIADISQIAGPKQYAEVAERFIQTQPCVDAPRPELESWATVLRSLSGLGLSLGVWEEGRIPDVHYVGQATLLPDGLRLRAMGLDGQWLDGFDRFGWDDISRLDFGDPYDQGVCSLAEDIPS